MSGHTLGPWAYDQDFRGRSRVFANKHEIVRALASHGLRRLPPKEREANARLIAAAPELLEALQELLKRDEINTCAHEDTHRGGAIWEICDACGAKWADDEGGKPEWREPSEQAKARAAIAKATGKD